MTGSKVIKLAIEAAHAAGDELMRRYRKPLKIAHKVGAGIVSSADFAAEKAALKVLKRSSDTFEVLAEETAKPSVNSHERKSGLWVLDPCDGTNNYVHGFPIFCVSLAAVWEGEIIAAVIYHPTFKETYTACKGKGAFCNGKKIRVSKIKKLSDGLLTTGFSYQAERQDDQTLSREIKRFENLSRKAQAVRRPGSAALDLAYVARGVFDAFWEVGLQPWDVAAGILLVREAGGIVTDLQGHQAGYLNSDIIAANTAMHKHVFDTISA